MVELDTVASLRTSLLFDGADEAALAGLAQTTAAPASSATRSSSTREAEPGARDVRLDWPYTQSDLAAMIGGTRQSVNKLLAGLVERGLVVIDRDTLTIPDVDALVHEADR